MFGEDMLALPPTTSSVSYPNMLMTGATYDTSTNALSGGGGVATITLPAGLIGVTMEGFVLVPSTPTSCVLFQITDSAGNVRSLTLNSDRTLYLHETGNGNDNSGSSSAISAGLHHIAVGWSWIDEAGGAGDYRDLHCLVDGVDLFEAVGYQHDPIAGTATFAVAVSSGVEMHSVRVSNGDLYTANGTAPSSPLSRISSTLGLWQLASSGVGS